MIKDSPNRWLITLNNELHLMKLYLHASIRVLDIFKIFYI